MKKVIGIICEYNPFHMGHKEQIDYIRRNFGEDSVIVAIMSGSFVQRGEPAVLPKYARAELAVKLGVDLVLELPYPYSCASAEYFADAAVAIVELLGGIDTLCFGSESGDIDALATAADNMLSRDFTELMREKRATAENADMSHVRLLEDTYRTLFGEGFPTSANDILGVEYIKAQRRHGSAVAPVTYRRVSPYSATSARMAWRRGDMSELSALVPSEALVSYKAYGAPADIGRAESLILFKLRDIATFDRIVGCSGGIERRIYNAAMQASSLDELFSLCSDKSYTSAKLRRTIVYCVTGTTAAELEREPAYTSLLAASKRGLGYLSETKKQAELDILTKPADYRSMSAAAQAQFECSLRAEMLYALCRRDDRSASGIFKKTPFIEK